MEDEKQTNNLELFYDVFDESNNYLYELTHANYFELILLTAKNILAGEVLNDFEPEEVKKLEEIYKPLEDVDFDVEEIRKAYQSIVLRGFKETRMSNGGTTPDTLGIFTAYLISKLEKEAKRKINLLDPLVGSGNYLFTVANHLTSDVSLFGVDHDKVMTDICSASADLMNWPIEIYLQDTLNITLKNMDYIIFDLPTIDNKEEDYFPYKLIKHYISSLSDNGYMIALIPNDFFSFDKNQEFKKDLTNNASIIGVIELPGDFFVSNPKSFLIISKKIFDSKKCLMAKLPSFSNVNDFNKTLVTIETWFTENIK